MYDLTTKVLTMDKVGDKTEVLVKVNAVSSGSFGLRRVAEMRARARALISSGIVNASVDTVADFATGDLERMTRVISSQVNDVSLVRTVYLVRVEVNSD